MHIRNLLLVTVATFVFSSAAALADESTADWSGLYVGAVADLNGGSTHFALPGDLNDALLQTKDEHTSFGGGGLIGFNWQFGSTVLGVDGDFTSGNGTSSVTACTVVDGCFTSAHDSFTTLNHLKTNWSGRVRARLGWSDGDTLFYAGAGYSFADTKLSLVGLCYDPLNPPVPTVYNFARSQTISGVNLSAGIERQVGDNFIVRAEYLFEDFGSNTYRGLAPEWNDRRIAVHNSAARVAVAYQL